MAETKVGNGREKDETDVAFDKWLGELLSEHRRRARLSQSELAERIGAHTASIGRLERGERAVTWRTLSRICAELGIDPKEFMPPVSHE